jgi:uncharacterized membrane protein
MSKKQLVLAFFENEAAADAAVTEIKQWDKASKEVKLGAIGVLVKDEEGKIKTHKLGKRQTALGAILFAIAGILSSGLTVVGGALFGGILGSFFHKGLGMSKDDMARIDSDLDDGKAAVAILLKKKAADAVTEKLVELGGVTEQHTVTDDALGHAEDAAENTTEEEAAE